MLLFVGLQPLLENYTCGSGDFLPQLVDLILYRKQHLDAPVGLLDDGSVVIDNPPEYGEASFEIGRSRIRLYGPLDDAGDVGGSSIHRAVALADRADRQQTLELPRGSILLSGRRPSRLLRHRTWTKHSQPKSVDRGTRGVARSSTAWTCRPHDLYPVVSIQWPVLSDQ